MKKLLYIGLCAFSILQTKITLGMEEALDSSVPPSETSITTSTSLPTLDPSSAVTPPDALTDNKAEVKEEEKEIIKETVSDAQLPTPSSSSTPAEEKNPIDKNQDISLNVSPLEKKDNDLPKDVSLTNLHSDEGNEPINLQPPIILSTQEQSSSSTQKDEIKKLEENESQIKGNNPVEEPHDNNDDASGSDDSVIKIETKNKDAVVELTGAHSADENNNNNPGSSSVLNDDLLNNEQMLDKSGESEQETNNDEYIAQSILNTNATVIQTNEIVENLAKTANAINNAAQETNTNINTLNETVKQSSKQITNIANSLTQYHDDIAKTTGINIALQQQVNTLRARVGNNQRAYQELQNQHNTLDQEKRQLTIERDAKKDELANIKDTPCGQIMNLFNPMKRADTWCRFNHPVLAGGTALIVHVIDTTVLGSEPSNDTKRCILRTLRDSLLATGVGSILTKNYAKYRGYVYLPLFVGVDLSSRYLYTMIKARYFHEPLEQDEQEEDNNNVDITTDRSVINHDNALAFLAWTLKTGTMLALSDYISGKLF